MKRRRGRSNKTKGQNQREHAIRRARERYNLYVSSHEYLEACRRIREGNATFIRRESLRVVHYSVELAGRIVPVVYDSSRGTIVTVLPEPMEAGVA